MKIIDLTHKRSNYSTISRAIENAAEKDFNLTMQVTVSENAPSCMKHNKTYPAKEGWIRVSHKKIDNKTGLSTGVSKYGIKEYPKIVYYYQSQGYEEMWIKTATLWGHSQIWVR